jgi:hypothetical protein
VVATLLLAVQTEALNIHSMSLGGMRSSLMKQLYQQSPDQSDYTWW